VEQIRDVARHDRLSVPDSLSINQSIPSRKFIRLPRGGYITRSRGPEGCLLQAFTAFRLSIKDKIPWLPLFAVHLVLIAHSGVETLTRPSPLRLTEYRLYSMCAIWQENKRGKRQEREERYWIARHSRAMSPREEANEILNGALCWFGVNIIRVPLCLSFFFLPFIKLELTPACV